MYNIILCEGETDSILISYYIGNTLEYRHVKNISTKMPNISTLEMINWYQDGKGRYLAIGSVGGNNFKKVLSEIVDYNRVADLQLTFQKIALIIDNDDESVSSYVKDIGDFLECEKNLSTGYWEPFYYTNDFIGVTSGEIACILQPSDGYGALETFVLNAFCQNNDEIKNVVNQAENFVNNFKSEQYLRKRREKIKAKLSVSLSVMYPSKTFTPIDSFLKGVKWDEYELFQNQFALFAHLNESTETIC